MATRSDRLRRLGGGNAAVATATLAGMVAGLGLDVVLAARLGTGQRADALLIALSLPLLLDTVAREGTKFSLVPLFMEQAATRSGREYGRYVSSIANLALVIGLAAGALIMLFAPALARMLAPGLTSAGQAEAGRLLRAATPMLIFPLASSVLAVYLNSASRFLLPALRNAITPLCTLAAMLIGWSSDQFGWWVAGGYSAGFTTYLLMLLRGSRRAGLRYDWSAWPDASDVRALTAASGLPTLGFFLRQGARLIERSIASTVLIGGVAAYYFAFRIFSAGQTLIGLTIAMTGLPGLVRHARQGDDAGFLRAVRRNVAQALLFSLPAVLGLIVFRGPIVELLYGRGSFGADSVALTAQLLIWFGIGLPFTCLSPVLQSALYAHKRYGLVFRNMLIVSIVNVALAWLFARSWGLQGIAAAVALSAVFSVAQLLLVLRTLRAEPAAPMASPAEV